MPIPRIDNGTGEPQTLDEVREWHQGIVDALLAQRASTLHAIRESSPVAPRFISMTEEELDEYFKVQRRELDRLSVLNLVASAEATIRMDFFRRVKDKLKDPLSMAYRKWFKKLSRKKQRRPDFDEAGILHVLKQSGVMDKNIIGQFRECLLARNWVGHGRFWAKPVVLDRIDPDDVYTRAQAVLRSLP